MLIQGDEFDMQMEIQAILFDNDGTLIDSTPSILRCWDRWVLEHPAVTAFDRTRIFGRPAEAIVADHLPDAAVSAAVRRYEDLEAADVECVVLPGVRELLGRLPRDRWAVVTSASRRVAEARLRHAAIAAPLVVTADDTSRGKPDPEPFLVAAARLGLDPAACLVVEDAPAGLEAARAAGMRSVAVTTTHRAEQLDADLVVGSLGELRVRSDGEGLVLHVERPLRAADLV